MKVLVINAGSSSLKYQLMDPATREVFAKGLCERIGIDGRLTHKCPPRTPSMSSRSPCHPLRGHSGCAGRPAGRHQGACPGVILIPSTGGATGMTPEERLQPTELFPEMATLDCGTCNFGDDIFVNDMPTCGPLVSG